VKLEVSIKLPPGYKLNPLAPLTYRIASASPGGLFDLSDFEKEVPLNDPSPHFTVNLPASAETGAQTLHVAVDYYYCQERSAGLCKFGSVVWELPLELDPNATESSVVLESKAD
jgi:hypothetical protein